ncbi:MAG: hypothetical protein JXQ83_06220 [Candidatus Glassbacteria bacterium]|nr:hypothetical protein [Candidatus Glassbacteria bacterium]
MKLSRRSLGLAGVMIMLAAAGIRGGEQVPGQRKESLAEREAYFKRVGESRAAAWQAVSSGFEENFEYDNNRPLGPVSEREKELGAVPFVRSYMVPVFEESVPADYERGTGYRVRVARGEVEPVSFGVYALEDLDGLQVEVLDWQGPAPGSFEVCWVECAPVRHGRSSSARQWQVQPVRLWPVQPGETFRIAARRAFQFWGTLRVSAQAEPGDYLLPVRVSRGGKEIYTLELRVQVLPFELPAVKAAYGVYEGDRISGTEMADLVDHGCNSMSMWARWPEYREGSDTYELDGLDSYLRSLKTAGLGHSFVWYVATKSHKVFRMREEIGEKGIRLLARALDKGAAEGAYPQNVALTIDEAVCCDPEGTRGDQSPSDGVGNRWEDFIWLMGVLRMEAPHLKRFGVSLNRHQDALRHEGYIDILSCNGDLVENGSWCKKTGIRMYTYGSFNKCTYPAQSRFNAGFWPWAAGSDGTYCWAYKWTGSDPFNDFDGGVMDWMLVFPGPGGTLISTPAWEAWREGVDDRRYLELYESLVARGKADGALLERLRKQLQPDALMKETVVGDSHFGAIVGNYRKLAEARQSLIDAILAAR